jgi:hypothetical protein
MSKFNRAFSDEDLQRECWEPGKWIVSDEVKRAYAHIENIEHENHLLIHQTQPVSKTHTGRVIVEMERLTKRVAALEALKAKAIRLASSIKYCSECNECARESQIFIDEAAKDLV